MGMRIPGYEGKKWPYTGMFDMVPATLYDTQQITQQRHYRFFYEPISVERGRDITNMQLAARLPPPCEFMIDRVSVYFLGLWSPTQYRLFCESSVVTVWVGQKYYMQEPLLNLLPRGSDSNAPLKRCLACSSIFTDLKCQSCGSPEWKYLDRVEGEEVGNSTSSELFMDFTHIPITIPSEMLFWAEINVHGDDFRQVSDSFIRTRIVLHGQMARAIQ